MSNVIKEEVTLKKLHVFIVLMEHGTMCKTAEVLGISTVSVHRAIHSLEEDLRCPLFQPSGRILIPLPYAYIFAQKVRTILTELQQSITDIQQASGLFSNHFKIGALYSLIFGVLPKLVAGLKLRQSNLDIELVPTSNKKLFEKLNNLDVDAIIVALDEDFHDSSLLTLPIFTDDLALAVPSDDPIAKSASIKLSDLSTHEFVMLSHGFATSEAAQMAFIKAGITPHVALEVNDVFSAVSMIKAGVGYSLLPNRVEVMAGEDITFVPLSNQDNITQTITLVCLACREKDPRILKLIAECRVFSRTF